MKNNRKTITFDLHLVILFLFILSVLLMTCAKSSGNLYVEKDGLVRVDIENLGTLPNGWAMADTFAGYEGEGYLVWIGEDNFSTPGEGIINFSVKITNPGTYQFVWRSRIGAGNSNTDHNDSWLRIPAAADFYGEKASTGRRVYPRGTGQSPNPEGASKDGWLKVYMHKFDEWFWRSSTNDRDAYNIFAKFDSPGTYDVQISGRSNSHAIDQFVLFRTDKTLSQATAAEQSEIIPK